MPLATHKQHIHNTYTIHTHNTQHTHTTHNTHTTQTQYTHKGTHTYQLSRQNQFKEKPGACREGWLASGL